MRTFYIFNVNRQTSVLSKDSPYLLFKSLEAIYKARKQDLVMASNLYDQITSKLNKDIINNKVSTYYENNDFYMQSLNHHSYYNKYRDESLDIEVKNSYIIVTCNKENLNVFKNMKDYNLFACDFNNKDYFWLDEIYT